MTVDQTLWIAAACLVAFLTGGILGIHNPIPEDDPIPYVLQLDAEDELCTDVVWNPFTEELTAEVWRGDPDTCVPL